MKWRLETFSEREQRLAVWRPWFAWYPVKIMAKEESSGKTVETRVWLETIEVSSTFNRSNSSWITFRRFKQNKPRSKRD
jgi:hypothetical protein